jgi:hypothetical protein
MMLNKKEEDISENQTWVARTVGEQAPNWALADHMMEYV